MPWSSEEYTSMYETFMVVLIYYSFVSILIVFLDGVVRLTLWIAKIPKHNDVPAHPIEFVSGGLFD
jgi:hypothetical protein